MAQEQKKDGGLSNTEGIVALACIPLAILAGIAMYVVGPDGLIFSAEEEETEKKPWENNSENK